MNVFIDRRYSGRARHHALFVQSLLAEEGAKPFLTLRPVGLALRGGCRASPPLRGGEWELCLSYCWALPLVSFAPNRIPKFTCCMCRETSTCSLARSATSPCRPATTACYWWIRAR